MCIRTARLPKTLPHSVPMSSRVPALRQPIPGVTLGLCFLGHPTPSGLAAWSPAPASSERAPDGFPCSGATLPGCRPSLRDFRVVLYAVSHVSSENHVTLEYVAEWGHFPFGPASQPFWQVLTHDASNIPSLPTHSHLLGAVAACGWQLIPFSPLHSAVRVPRAQRRVMQSPLHLGGRS